MIERREAMFLASFFDIHQTSADWEIQTRRHIIGSDYGHTARTHHRRAFFQGSVVGTTDSHDTMNFAELTIVRPMIETFALEKAAEAYARMMSGKTWFYVVLTYEHCGSTSMKRPFRFHALAIAPGVYQFIRQKIEFLGPGVQTFSFTFVK